MFTRGSVVLEVALIIGMFSAIATFASLHQEVARQEAQAQYAATAQAGTTGTQTAAEKPEGDQELCKDGENYDVQISGTDGSTNAQFKETSRPADFMVPPFKKRPCNLTFSTGDGKRVTVSVPNGGKLDDAYKPANLSATGDRYSSAVDQLAKAQLSGDTTQITNAVENMQEASKEYSQALDSAYADKSSTEYAKAKQVVSGNEDLLSQITKNPAAITAEQVQTIKGGLSDIEAARIAALGSPDSIGHGFGVGTSPYDLSDPLTASKIGGLTGADAWSGKSFTDGANRGASTFESSKILKTETPVTAAAQKKLLDEYVSAKRDAETAQATYDACWTFDFSDACYMSAIDAAQDRLATAEGQLAVSPQVRGAADALAGAEVSVLQATQKVEELQDRKDSCWYFSCPTTAEITNANKQLVSAQDAFVKAQNKYNIALGGSQNSSGVTTGSIPKTGGQVPTYDYGGAAANTQGRTTVFSGQTNDNVNDLKSAITELNQQPLTTGSRQPQDGRITTGSCPPGMVRLGNTCVPQNSGAGYQGLYGGPTRTQLPQTENQNPLAQLGKMLGLGGQQSGASGANGGSTAAQQACAKYPGTTLQNGQCTCPSGQGWNGSACVQSNPCAQYPGTTLQNGQCTCPTGQNWTGSKCEAPAGTNGGLKAELACAPQIQESGKPIVISWSCENASTKRADGFAIDTSGSAMSGSAEVVATTTNGTGQTQTSMQFGLTCIKEGQTHQAQCSVGVFRPFMILVATPAEVESGKPTRIGWITGGMRNTGDACTLTSPELPDLIRQGSGGTIDIPSITQETVFKLSCITQAGSTKETEVTVKLK